MARKERDDDGGGFSGKRNKIVYEALNFPSVMYVYEAHARGAGARIVEVPSEYGITIDTQRMLNAIADIQHVEAAGPVKFTISIGVATYSTRQRFPSTLALLEAADHALYAAKLCGRNRFEAFEDLSASGRSASSTARAGRGSSTPPASSAPASTTGSTTPASSATTAGS